MTPKDKFSAKLTALIAGRDGDKAWDYLHFDRSGLTELEQLRFSQKLFEERWHGLHNELAYEFQRAANPATATWILEQIAGGEIPELDYRPVSRVLTWALADIGGEASWEYLQKVAVLENEHLALYARKRLAGWTDEARRKTVAYPVNGWSRNRLPVAGYTFFQDRLPASGRCIVASQTAEDIIVYQAYNHAIADWAVANQSFGGPAFSYNRMSWIKPNFLWMMYRCGWASKHNQERVLAITTRKTDWEDFLREAVFSSYQSEVYQSPDNWKQELTASEVRLQWDPAHDPYGKKLDRKAIQIGIKGNMLRRFGTEMVQRIDDVTEYVKLQKCYVDAGDLDELEVPQETLYEVMDKRILPGIGLA